MKRFTYLPLLGLCVGASLGFGQPAREGIVPLESRRSYDTYTVEELKRRVFQLELAVEQLQRRVFDYDRLPTTAAGYPAPAKPYTCYMVSFGKTLVETADSETAARAKILKACSDSHHATLCPEKEIKCGQ